MMKHYYIVHFVIMVDTLIGVYQQRVSILGGSVGLVTGFKIVETPM
jgi:hypothetical protein